MKVIDWDHFSGVDEVGVVPDALIKEVNYLQRIIMAATSRAAGLEVVTAVRCRKRPVRKQCPGHLAVRLQDVPSKIYWRCTHCEDAGVISNWRDSSADLSGYDPKPGDGSKLVQIFLDEDDYEALLWVTIVDPQVERIVHGARFGDREVILEGRFDDLDELVSYVAGEADHAEGTTRQRRLDRLYENLSDSLEVD